MGMFDFVRDAGEALTEKVMGSTTNEDVTATTAVSQERIDQLRGEQIAAAIAQLDIDGEQVSVDVNGSTVVLKGSAPGQDALEKMVLCAGNQFGIENVDCQLGIQAAKTAVGSSSVEGVTAPLAGSAFYTVQAGDTLSKIAQAHYGSGNKYTAIFEANKPMLSDPNKIYPGQKLRLPVL